MATSLDMKDAADVGVRAGAPQVTITRPPVVVPRSSLSCGLLVPPIGPAYLAACAREAGYRVSIVDPVGEDPFEVNPLPGRPLVTYGWSVEKIVSAFPADTKYIGVSCMFSHEWPVSKRLIRMLRDRFPVAVIVVGGEHVTAAADFCLTDCPEVDFVVLGEGEETFVALLNVLDRGGDVSEVDGLASRSDGKPSQTKPRQRVRDVDDIPWPAWDLVPIESFLANDLSYGVGAGRTMPIMATRGCPFACTFCSSPTMWTQRWYPRSVSDVADEIQAYAERSHATNFDFYDLTAIIRKDWIVEFCRELIRRDLRITWQLPAGTRCEAIDEEVAELLVRSGHRNIVYAPESGSPRMLKIIKKKVSLPNMLKSMRGCIANGLSVKMNMIVGFPEETFADILRTYWFLMRAAWIGVDDATIATFAPYPGSAMFNDLCNDGRINGLNDDFFYDLATMGDTKNAISYAKHISGRALLICKLIGVALFYGVSYLSHPARFTKTLWHLYRRDHRTRIEKALSAFIQKNRRVSRIQGSVDGREVQGSPKY